MPCHLARYLLLTKYRGELLNYEKKECCITWLYKIKIQLIPYVINFELKGNSMSHFLEDVIKVVSDYKWLKSISKAC